MDYERKELVDWIRGIYQSLDEADKQDALRFFPELRESEDERIRKSLINFLSSFELMRDDATFRKSDFDLDSIKGYILYLEKQKEQKPISQEDFDAAKHEALWEEQKPAEKQDYSGLNDLERAIHRGFLCAGVENVPVGIIKETAKDCLAHMPVEWSEEDKTRLTNILIMLQEYVIHHYSKDDVNKSVDWLKALPERFNLQPKPEWSEEDERMRNQLIYDVEQHKEKCLISAKQNKATKTFCDGIEKCQDEKIAWLKSLRHPKDEIYKEKDEAFKLGKHQLAIKFMNYLDENRPEGKMCLSNGECEDIDKAFNENDWAKIVRYVDKMLKQR